MNIMLALDIVWFLGSLFIMIRSIVLKIKEDFVPSLMALLVTPVGFILASGLLFVLMLIFLFDIVPNLIFKEN